MALLDTSASMLRHRTAKAKGLFWALADSAGRPSCYALIECGGESARIALWPTRSRDRFKEAVAAAKSGGATPLAEGLREAARIARRYDPQGRGIVRLLAVTDGGANLAPPGGDAWRSLIAQGEALRKSGARLLIVDARGAFTPGGRAKELAQRLGAAYAPLSALE